MLYTVLVSQPSVVACGSVNVRPCLELAKIGVFILTTFRSAATWPSILFQHISPFHPSPSFSRFLFVTQRPFPRYIPIMTTKEQATSDAVDDGPPISVPDSEDTGENGKLKMIVQLVRKCMGIKDIASM